MSRLKNQKSFHFDSYKIVICRNCGRIVGESHLGEKYERTVKCKECKNIQIISPPREGIMGGKKGAFWCEPSNSCFTAYSE